MTVCGSVFSYTRNSLPNNIGIPLKNIKYFILNEELQPVTPGTVGELYIGGVGVARGYLNNLQLTQERFIKNPFQTTGEGSQNDHSVIYKTGDLVKHLSSGEFEYIGRSDFQIKIRGHRIELGEIEECLIHYPGIHQATVTIYNLENGDNTKNQYLVGYYVTKEKNLNNEEILKYLQSYLPDYMIPATLIPLEKLPLTTNGKLDKSALPDPRQFLFTARKYIAPKTRFETKLVEIWSKVLNLDTNYIGIHDDFFKLGGNSILAIQVVSQFNELFNLKVPVITLFKLRTIELFCSNSHSYQDLKQKETACSITLELHHLEKLMVQHSLLNPSETIYNESVVIETNGYIEPNLFKEIVKEITLKYEILNVNYEFYNDKITKFLNFNQNIICENFDLKEEKEANNVFQNKINLIVKPTFRTKII